VESPFKEGVPSTRMSDFTAVRLPLVKYEIAEYIIDTSVLSPESECY